MRELVGKGAFGSIYKEDNYLYKEIVMKDHSISEIMNQVKKNLIIQKVYAIPRTYQLEFLDDKFVIKKDFVEGESLLDYFFNHQDIGIELLKEMALKQYEINNVTCKLNCHFSTEIIRKIAKLDLTLELKNPIISELEALEKENFLCHGDFHPGNIIYTDGKMVVIDWDNAVNGNRYYDVARSFMLLYLFNPDLGIAYYQISNGIEKIDKETFIRYLSYVAIECLTESSNNKKWDLLVKFIKREVEI